MTIDKKIPMKKVYHNKGGKLWTTQEPLYRLKSKSEEMAYQDGLGKFIGFYYGTDMYKCCGVYPKLMVEQSFDANAYFICLVCGKESGHFPMPWQAQESWQEMNKPYEQISIFDLMGE